MPGCVVIIITNKLRFMYDILELITIQYYSLFTFTSVTSLAKVLFPINIMLSFNIPFKYNSINIMHIFYGITADLIQVIKLKIMHF